MKGSKKISIIIAITLSVLAIAFFVARITGVFQSYHIPTASMRPTIPVGDKIFASNLKKPNRFDIIVFRYTDTSTYGSGKEETRVCRLVGMPGDKIEIRNGDLYVNNRPADRQLNIMNDYIIPSDITNRIIELTGISNEPVSEYAQPDIYPIGTGDSSLATLSSAHIAILQKEKLSFNRYNLGHFPIGEIVEGYDAKWGADNFGPFTVPANHYFVIGDNRHQSQDSRYTGPIPASQWVGTVLNR